MGETNHSFVLEDDLVKELEAHGMIEAHHPLSLLVLFVACFCVCVDEKEKKKKVPAKKTCVFHDQDQKKRSPRLLLILAQLAPSKTA